MENIRETPDDAIENFQEWLYGRLRIIELLISIDVVL